MIEVISMFKKIIIFDILIGLMGCAIIFLINNAYEIYFLMGLLSGTMIYIVSGMVTSMLVIHSRKNKGFFWIINFLKAFFVCIIGALLFDNNINNMIWYVLGYTSHLISLILYSVFYLSRERK